MQFENVLKWGLPRRVVQAGFLVGLDFTVLTNWVRLLAPTDDAVGEACSLSGIYADGGENERHAHLDHDHSFIVLEGQATFYDYDDNPTVVNKYEGIMLPRGVAYWFLSSAPV